MTHPLAPDHNAHVQEAENLVRETEEAMTTSQAELTAETKVFHLNRQQLDEALERLRKQEKICKKVVGKTPQELFEKYWDGESRNHINWTYGLLACGDIIDSYEKILATERERIINLIGKNTIPMVVDGEVKYVTIEEALKKGSDEK